METVRQLTTDQAYLTLELDEYPIEISNINVLQSTAFDLGQYTVEAWVDPYERDDLQPDDITIFAGHSNRWDMGFTGDGRLFARWWYVGKSGARVSLAQLSDNPVAANDFVHVSFTVNNQGVLTLYNHTTILKTAGPPADWAYTAQPVVPSERLTIGGWPQTPSILFKGRMRAITVSSMCKSAPDFITSM